MKKWALILVCGAVSLSACETTDFPRFGRSEPPPVDYLDDDFERAAAPPVTAPDNELPLATDQRFPDIPLPADAREDLQRTYVYQSGGFAVGRMVYNSRSSVNDLAQFYIKHMRAANWELERVTQAEGVQLTFTKPDKRLEVSVRSLGVGRSQELILHLTPARGPDYR